MTIGRTYLDYNATAPLRAEARAAMLAALDLAGNPSSVHAEGRRARAVIEAARTNVAALVGAPAADVVFTSGASEANATALAGGWDLIFLSALEHDSVRAAAKKFGAAVVDVPVTRDGHFDVTAFVDSALTRCDAFKLASGRNTCRALVSIQLANNETGIIQPVADVATFASAHGISVHCDAVQAPGRLAIACNDLAVDYLTISAHKFGGPKGAGALVIVDGAPLPALISGGGQERGRRAGTENIAAIAGFGAAARLALADLADIARVRDLRDRLEAGMAHLTPQAVVIGQNVPRLANTSCVALPSISAETSVIRLDLAGLAVSAGAACSSGKVGQSAGLKAMGLAAGLAGSAIRISVGYSTTDGHVDAFLAAWKNLAAAHQRAA